MIRIVEYSHQLLSKHGHVDIALDMTCGNGRDTLFLANMANKVYAFDIQTQALENTKSLLENSGIFNVNLFLKSHEYFDEFVQEPIDIAIYNLGYLPGGDHQTKTKSHEVLNSLMKLLDRLNDHGAVILVIYLHDQEESELIEDFVKTLPIHFDVVRHQILNRSQSPYIIEILKT